MPRKFSQHEKEKGCWFTAVSNVEESREKMKKNCKEYNFWAWVDHVPDKETEESDKHFHTHLIIRANGSRSIKQIADCLDIPANFIQVVHNPRSMQRYLRHLDNPDKIQYKAEDVHSNKPSSLLIAWTDNQDNDCRRLYSDLRKLQKGLINSSEFLDLHYLEFQKMPFYQKIKTYEVISKFECTRTT